MIFKSAPPIQPSYSTGSLNITTASLLRNEQYSLIYQIDSNELLLTHLKDLIAGTIIIDRPYFEKLSKLFNENELNEIKTRLYEYV